MGFGDCRDVLMNLIELSHPPIRVAANPGLAGQHPADSCDRGTSADGCFWVNFEGNHALLWPNYSGELLEFTIIYPDVG